MALSRALSRRSASLAALAPRCVRTLHQDGKAAGSPTPDEGAPSTSSSSSLDDPPLPGWLRGPAANKPNKSLEEEWEEVRDPHTGEVAWRSLLTGETTVPGAPKPDTWIEVVDKKTGLIYYWCKRTGVTTVLGEPKPGPYGRKIQIDPDEAAALEEGGGGGGRGGSGSEGGGPSLMRLVSNPLVIGVSLLAVGGIVYENLFK